MFVDKVKIHIKAEMAEMVLFPSEEKNIPNGGPDGGGGGNGGNIIFKLTRGCIP